MSLVRLRFALVSSVLVASFGTAQTVIQVTGGGNALQTAAAGAAPGTIFEVGPGRYDKFQWTVPDATIVAPNRASWAGPFSVAASAGRVTLRNFDIVTGQRFGGYYYYPDPGWIWSNGATVIMDNCTSRGLRLTNCTLSCSNSRVGGEDTSVTMTNVDAAMSDVIVDPGFFYSSYGFDMARPAMRARDSRVRMERCRVTGQNVFGQYLTAGEGLIVEGTSIVTVADSYLEGAPGAGPGSFPPPADALRVAAGSDVTLSNTTIVGVTSGTFSNALLATAEWVTGGGPIPMLAPGASLVAQFSEQPSTACAVLLSFDFAPFSNPLVAEQLFVLGTPNWIPLIGGITDGFGDFFVSITIPNMTSFEYRPIWLTGLFGGSLPVRSTAPLGGVIY